MLHGHEAAPIVVNNTMYVVTPWPNLVYALDLTKDGAPVKWKYESKPLSASQGVACCDVVNRGVVFKAINAKTGEQLWKSKVGSGVVGQPVTYKGPDGKQYVAVLAGVGGWSGAIVSGDLDPRDVTAAFGFVNAMPDLPQATTSGGMLYIFGLP